MRFDYRENFQSLETIFNYIKYFRFFFYRNVKNSLMKIRKQSMKIYQQIK